MKFFESNSKANPIMCLEECKKQKYIENAKIKGKYIQASVIKIISNKIRTNLSICFLSKKSKPIMTKIKFIENNNDLI